jgi:hypothetical protein
MKKDFKDSSRDFLKWQIHQTFTVLTSLLNMVRTFDKPKNKLMDYTDANADKGGYIRKNVQSVKRFLKQD